MSRRYVLITPCRDEAEYLRATIERVAKQSVLPAKWVIVDDGSTDETPQIIEEAAKIHPFIHPVRRPDRGRRSVGPGVIDAFYTGLEAVQLDQYDYLCKLDADLELPPRYFESLMARFEADPWLGTFSGKVFVRYDGRLVEERIGDENSVGAAKFYHVECFKDIGGFLRQVSWDGIDGHVCRRKGWIALSSRDGDLRIIHRRRTGSSDVSFWEGRKRWGRGKYFMGSAPYYVLATSIYRMFERPYVVSGVGILWGYLLAAFQRSPRYRDEQYVRHLRRYELSALLLGRRRTLNRYNDRIRRRFNRPSRSENRQGTSAESLGVLS